MKKHFFTGLAIILPIFLTLLLVWILFNLLTKPFLGVMNEFLTEWGVVGNRDLIQLLSRIAIFIILIGTVFIVGFLGQVFLTRAFFSLTDQVILKIPVVNKIYKAFRDVVQTLFVSKEKKFSQVVLIPFPQKGSQSLGLVTNECMPEGSDEEHAGLLSVFVPGTPNPTMGFMLMFQREEVIFIDMNVDEALKIIISCGVISDKITSRL